MYELIMVFKRWNSKKIYAILEESKKENRENIPLFNKNQIFELMRG